MLFIKLGGHASGLNVLNISTNTRTLRLSEYLTPKQIEGYRILKDDVTEEFLFGGAAGGGKSTLGCCWAITNSLKYPDCRGLIGRAVLARLKETTLETFWRVLSDFGMSKVDVNYNDNKSIVTFTNESKIFLRDLQLNPRDKYFDDLGSLDLTWAYIDECGQVVQRAKDAITSRLRHNLEEYGIIGKLLMTTNPCKNFLYRQFYKAKLKGELPEYRKFLVSKVADNPHLHKGYVAKLERMDKVLRDRLLHGLWDFDTDKLDLFGYDALCDMFTNTHVALIERMQGFKKWITADIATKGKDKFVIGVWYGWTLKEVVVIDKCDERGVLREIKRMMQKHGVFASNVIYDSDGVGNIVGLIRGTKGFVNNARPVAEDDEEKPQYENLRAQCYYRLGKKVNERGVYVDDNKVSESVCDIIMEELEAIRKRDVDKDGKLKVSRREELVVDLGHSPDFATMVMLRAYGDLIENSMPYESVYA